MGPEGVGASTASEGPTGTRWRERVSTKKQRWRTGTTSAFDESPGKKYLYDELHRADVLNCSKVFM
tara:strand:- start:485 stop:682 length:198 start_codon:yes stop_codon:yes gene_type:complete